MHAERMDYAYGLLDAGKFEEALAAFEVALQSDDPLAPRALLGMAELFEKLGDDETRLQMAKGAFEFDDRSLKLSMMHHHYIPLMWPSNEDVVVDPEKAGRSKSSLLVQLAEYLPEDLLEGSIEFEIAEFISEVADWRLYFFDVRIAEALLQAGFMLANQEDVLENQYKTMSKLHFFLRLNPPARIGATMLMNEVKAKWSHFDGILDFFEKCENHISSMQGTVMTDENLLALDSQIDELLSVQEFDFFNTYIAFSILLDQLISEERVQENPVISQLDAKYRSWKNKHILAN